MKNQEETNRHKTRHHNHHSAVRRDRRRQKQGVTTTTKTGITEEEEDKTRLNMQTQSKPAAQKSCRRVSASTSPKSGREPITRDSRSRFCQMRNELTIHKDQARLNSENRIKGKHANLTFSGNAGSTSRSGFPPYQCVRTVSNTRRSESKPLMT